MNSIGAPNNRNFLSSSSAFRFTPVSLCCQHLLGKDTVLEGFAGRSGRTSCSGDMPYCGVLCICTQVLQMSLADNLVPTWLQNQFPNTLEFTKDLDAWRAFLGRYGISGKMQTTKIAELSDGQKVCTVLHDSMHC